MKTMRRPFAFTLIELLVVIAIIGVLAAIILPSLAAAQRRARLQKCNNNLHQICIGAQTLLGEMKDNLPNLQPGEGSGPAAAIVLPYVRSITAIFDCPANKFPQPPTALISGTQAYTDYSFNTNCFGIGTQKRRQSTITDFSLAAFAFDSAIEGVHDRGLNVGYLDGHAVFVQTNAANFLLEGVAR